MADEGNKPHPATPKRRDEARKEGRFPRARDTTAIASMVAVVAVMVWERNKLVDLMDALFARCHGDLDALARGDGGSIAASMPDALATLALPPAIAAAIAGAVVGAWQAGWRLYPQLLAVKPEKLNPLPKLLDLLNPKKALFELALAVMRVGVVGWVCYDELRDDVPLLLGLTGAPIGSSIALMATMLLRMTLKAIGVLLVLAVVDYVQSRYLLEKSMRMNDQEIKEEMRQYDQDPKIKGKLRERMRQAARKRILAAVAKADAVVTNPTHISVALRYADTDFAPVVVAKGHDQLALRIRSEARKHSIPILENRPLARALDAEVEVGQPIPGQHYLAVAKVLAFVFSIKGRRDGKRRK
jgi:flagellar biosynthetic protein FlhB